MSGCLLHSRQRTSCMLPTDQLCTTVPLITDKQETTPIFHAGISYWKSLRKRIPHLELCVESEHAQDLIDDTLWCDFIHQVHFCPPYSCTIRYFSMSRNCSTWCRSLLLSFSTCYLGIVGLEGAINCILAQTSHQRTDSEKRTKALLPKCPLFRGSTALLSSSLCQTRVHFSYAHVDMRPPWWHTLKLWYSPWC